MSTKGVPLAGIDLAQQSVSPARLRQIARNKLNALSIQTYFTKELLRGRLLIEPARFSRVRGLTLEPVQHIVVDGHDKFWFTKPSPLRFLGPVPFFLVRTQQEILQIVEQRWRALLDHSKRFHARVRTYFPAATFDFETWSVHAFAQDQFGRVTLRVLLKGEELWAEVIAVDGAPLLAVERPALMLPQRPESFDERDLMPLMATVRRQQGKHLEDSEAVELDLGSLEPSEDLQVEEAMEVAAIEVSEVVRAPAQGPPSEVEALSMDLALPTDDLMEQAPDLEPPELDPRFLTEVAPETPLERAPPIHERPPRLVIPMLPAVMRMEERSAPVRLCNANYGGVFAAMPLSAAPEVDEVVQLEGFGPLRARARVAHRRTAAEASLFASEEGVGLAFLEPEASLAPVQERPAVLLLLEEEAQARACCAAPGVLKLCPPDLVTAALMMRSIHIGAIVSAPGALGYNLEALADALRMITLGIKGILIGSSEDLASPFVRTDWASLDAALEAATR